MVGMTGMPEAALAREIGANGFAISPQDLQKKISEKSSWMIFAAIAMN